jgi:membrane protein
MRLPVGVREPVSTYFTLRGPHLAAMIAYFALLSLVPLVFLSLSLLGLAGQPRASSFLVTELQHAFPGSSIASVVRVVGTVRNNAAALGIAGGIGLAWSSLSLFSGLESAFNIVYGLHNRTFMRGKGLAIVFLIASIVTLFAALLAASLGVEALRRLAPGLLSSPVAAYVVSIAASSLGILAFLLAAYRTLTNTPLTWRAVAPGAVAATIVLQATFQLLPLYLRLSNESVALQVFGGPVVLLVWLYVMANVVLLGATVNRWLEQRSKPA